MRLIIHTGQFKPVVKVGIKGTWIIVRRNPEEVPVFLRDVRPQVFAECRFKICFDRYHLILF